MRGHGRRHREAVLAGDRVLVLLVHDRVDLGPGRPGAAEEGADLGLARAERRDRLVVGGVEHAAAAPSAPQLQQVVDEPRGLGERVGRDGRGGVARDQADGVGVVVAGDHRDALAAQAADDRERVRARRLQDDRGGAGLAHAAAIDRSRSCGGRSPPRCTPRAPPAGPPRPCAPRGPAPPAPAPGRRRARPGRRAAPAGRSAVADDLRGAVHRRRHHRPAQFIASQITVGSPSLSEGSTNRSPAAIHQPTSSWATLPTNRTRSAMPSAAARRSSAGRSSPIPAATSSGAPAGAAGEQAHRLDERVHALARHELAHVAHDRAVVGQAQAGARLGGGPGQEGCACRRRWARPHRPARRRQRRGRARDRGADGADLVDRPHGRRDPPRLRGARARARPGRRRGGPWRPRGRPAARRPAPPPSRRAPACGRGSTSNGQRSCTRRRGPATAQSMASAFRWPSRAPGRVSLRG